MSQDRPFNVLFVCRRNASRSLMAEGLLRKWGMGRFETFSAGPEPVEVADPITLDLLNKVSIDTENLRPKHWDLFTGPDAPTLDFVFFVCEEAAARPQPTWNGHPMVATWGFPDPLSLEGSETERRALLNLVFGMIERRVKIFCALPDHRLARLTASDMSDIALAG
jgi:arsenate reductase (thioredoxin)